MSSSPRVRRILTVLALAAVTGLLAQSPARAASSVKVTITSINPRQNAITVAGRVALSGVSAQQRARTRVAFTLTDAAGEAETFAAKVNAKHRFSTSHATALTGKLRLVARIRIADEKRGRAATRTFEIAGGPLADGNLPGTFKLDPGTAGPSGYAGTFFRMLTPGGDPLSNGDSTAPDKTYTLLRPGRDGGLRTDAFQAPPQPAFAANGNALADRIVQPATFYGTKFSVVTSSTDPQLGTTDPLPEIHNTGGTLSGQLTAWAAQWNNNSFNQGTPKPDGSRPGTTTALSGAIDTTTHHYTLEWKSLIVGGPFNGFTGAWHLEGTFVPADSGAQR